MHLAEIACLLYPDNLLLTVRDEVTFALDYNLHGARGMVHFLSRGKASAVVDQRQLWLTPIGFPGRDSVSYPDEAVAMEGFFGESLCHPGHV